MIAVLDRSVLLYKAFLDLVGDIKRKVHVSELICNRLNFGPWCELPHRVLWIIEDLKEGLVVHDDLLTLVAHLEERIIELGIELFHFKLLLLVEFVQVKFLLLSPFLVCLVILFFIVAEEVHHERVRPSLAQVAKAYRVVGCIKEANFL